MTLVFSSNTFARHKTGFHPECADRVEGTARFLEQQSWFSRLPKGQISRAAAQLIKRTHDAGVVARAEALSRAGGGALDADTVVSADSFEVGLFAAGTATAAVDQVLRGHEKTAFCLIRPPGHHATLDQSMGFCLFNNVAIAAHYAKDVYGLERILIVDFDVHHGNGTQDIFYEDPSVTFFSIHRAPFYPYTGTAEETGRGAGLGSTINVPLAFGTSRPVYLDRFRSALDRSLAISRPQLILVSAGFDAYKADPIGSLGLELEDYATLTQILREAAQAYCEGRIVSCLEGGYHLGMLPELIAAHIQTLDCSR